MILTARCLLKQIFRLEKIISSTKCLFGQVSVRPSVWSTKLTVRQNFRSSNFRSVECLPPSVRLTKCRRPSVRRLNVRRTRVPGRSVRRPGVRRPCVCRPGVRRPSVCRPSVCQPSVRLPSDALN